MEEFSTTTMFDEGQEDRDKYIDMLKSGVPAVIETEEATKIVVYSDESDSEDVKTVKSNIEFIVNNAREAVSFLIQLGKQTGNPRFFETVNSLLNTINSASGQLLNANRAKREAKQPEAPPTPTSVTNVQNNTTIAMTTTQAMDLMRQRSEGKLKAIDVVPGSLDPSE